MSKTLYAALVATALIGAPLAAFAQQVQPYTQPYPQPYAQTPAAAAAVEPSQPAQPDYLNVWPQTREDGANPAVDADSYSPVFAGPRPSSAH